MSLRERVGTFARVPWQDFVLPHHTHDLHAVWGTEAKPLA